MSEYTHGFRDGFDAGWAAARKQAASWLQMQYLFLTETGWTQQQQPIPSVPARSTEALIEALQRRVEPKHE